MADTKLSALAAVSAVDAADELYTNDAGTSRKATAAQLKTFVDQRVVNSSVANQSFTTADTYMTGSDTAIPDGRLQAKTSYWCGMQLTKTSVAGTATPIIIVRVGTAGTTADAARCTLTFAAQTAVADVGWIDIFCTFRTVGSGTTAILQAVGVLGHELQVTGLSVLPFSIKRVTSSGFDSTVSGLKIGCSFNGGASFAGNTDLVQAQLGNLT